jgi:hypothetical protein
MSTYARPATPTTTTSTATPTAAPTTTSGAGVDSAARPSGRPVAGVLLAAYLLSIAYTIWSSATGVAPAAFSVSSPGAWAAYAVGLAVTALALKDGRAARLVVTGWLVLSIAVALFVYPQAFTPAHQTAFGFVENDLYTGLLLVALDRQLRRRR